ncbi:poly(A) polymerase [Nocardioides sp. J9]|nr:poly(A) polymerase [Nocardioides sp. J9]
MRVGDPARTLDSSPVTDADSPTAPGTPLRLVDVQAAVSAELDRIGPVLDELGALFADAGHELALVGGPVRDAMLGRRSNDLDFTTSARPEQTDKLLRAWGDAWWDMGRDFGTIGCRKGDWVVEVTTYRSEAYERDSRKPEVQYGDSLAGDLGRRDFTVNAMAVRVPGNEIEDPYGGVMDLAHKVLRTPGTPEQSFSDDPLRMMRAARFAAQLGFTVAPEVVAAMTEMAERIEIISAERVRDELVKLVCAPYPRLGLTLLVETGLADRVLPELPALKLERDEHHRHKDVYEHTLTVLEQAIDLEPRLAERAGIEAPDFVSRFAALMHDVGKPRTRRFVDDGTVTFHHHDVVGAKLTRKRMKALKFSNDEVDAVGSLVELHLRFHGYGSGEWTDSAVRRYVRDAGDQLERLHVLTRADCTTRNKRKADRLRRTYDDLEARIDRLSAEEELKAIRPDLDGNQIMEILGIPPGREVGEAYKFLLELRLDNGPMSEEDATAALEEWWAGRGGAPPGGGGGGGSR